MMQEVERISSDRIVHNVHNDHVTSEVSSTEKFQSTSNNFVIYNRIGTSSS